MRLWLLLHVRKFEFIYIAPGTVRVHVHAILYKLEVSDRFAEAVD